MHLSLAPRLEYRLEQRLAPPEPHSPIRTPEITEQALDRAIPLHDIGPNSYMSHRILSAEHEVYHRTGSDNWKRYLDTPFIAHADAAITLGKLKKYDAAVAILSAGRFYANILSCIGGMSYHEVDFSHHKRNMEKPVIEEETLDRLKEAKRVLLVDVDTVTGKTLREVYQSLRSEGVNVDGAYLGLSVWPGMKIKGKPCLGRDTGGFGQVWTISPHGLRTMRRIPKIQRIIPDGLTVYGPNGELIGRQGQTRTSRYDELGQIADDVIKELRRQDMEARR